MEYKENNKNNKESGKERKVCVEILKNIQNSLYGTDNVEVLLMVKEKLKEIYEFLDENEVKLCGIPTRLKYNKKKKLSRQKWKRSQNTRKERGKIEPMDTVIVLEDSEVGDDPDCNDWPKK